MRPGAWGATAAAQVLGLLAAALPTALVLPLIEDDLFQQVVLYFIVVTYGALFSFPAWLMVTVPFLAFADQRGFAERRRPMTLAGAAMGALAMLAIFLVLSQGGSAEWDPVAAVLFGTAAVHGAVTGALLPRLLRAAAAPSADGLAAEAE